MYHLITNPASQSGNDHTEIVRLIGQALEEKGERYRALYTEKAGDAERFAEEITGNTGKTDFPENSFTRRGENERDIIIVIGGDGTINGVINGIRDFSQVRLGIVPAGSANDLAKGLGIPVWDRGKGQREIVRSIAEGKVRRIIDLGQLMYDSYNAGNEQLCHDEGSKVDVSGKICSRLFAVSAGIGFDAGVCHESDVSRTRKRFNALHLGALTYGTIALRQLITTPEAKGEIAMSDGKELHIGKLVFATFMNTPFEGGGYKFAPDAVPDDALINVSAIGDLSKLTVLVNFPSAHKGTYYRVSGVYHAKAAEMEVHTDQPLWVHTDGEVIGKLSHFSIRCVPHVLNMII